MSFHFILIDDAHFIGMLSSPRQLRKVPYDKLVSVDLHLVDYLHISLQFISGFQ